jgi:hypothetical protein
MARRRLRSGLQVLLESIALVNLASNLRVTSIEVSGGIQFVERPYLQRNRIRLIKLQPLPNEFVFELQEPKGRLRPESLTEFRLPENISICTL